MWPSQCFTIVKNSSLTRKKTISWFFRYLDNYLQLYLLFWNSWNIFESLLFLDFLRRPRCFGKRACSEFRAARVKQPQRSSRISQKLKMGSDWSRNYNNFKSLWILEYFSYEDSIKINIQKFDRTQVPYSYRDSIWGAATPPNLKFF